MIRRLRARVHEIARSMLAAHTTPRALAAAVFVGAIIGASPLFGLHIVICIAAAWALRLNQAAVYGAANISIPPLVPFLGFACLEVGERVLHGKWLPLTVDGVRNHEGTWWDFAWHFGLDWLVGGAFVGAAIGAVMAAVVFVVATRRARANPAAMQQSEPSLASPESPQSTPSIDPDTMAFGGVEKAAPNYSLADEKIIEAAIVEASNRYRTAAPNLRWYAWFKYRMDPCYRRIAALTPPGSLTVDLGTGLGMLPLVLALLPGEREALGVEWDEVKRAAGEVAAAGLGGRVRLVGADARRFELPPCDTVTIVDMLHYFDPAEQRAILSAAAKALRPGGQVLVREGDARRAGGGARWTRAIEALAVRIGWNRGEGETRFRSADDLMSDLRGLGLEVNVEPLAGRFHPGNILIRGSRGTASKVSASMTAKSRA